VVSSTAAASPARIFSSPLRYVQGPGALDQVGRFAALGHSRAALLVDAFIADAVEPRLLASLTAEGLAIESRRVDQEVTAAHIDELAAEFAAGRPDVVVAAGGGKTLDLGKGVSAALSIPIITVPTIASNDGPTSRVIAQYDDEHRLIATPTMPFNPEAVIVDTALIGGAPRHFLLSGIGDALAKTFEAAATVRSGGVNSHSTAPLGLPLAIGAHCYSVLLRDGTAALEDLGGPTVSPELENVIEAVVLMSGLAFENGGLSIAHAMTRGLMAEDGASSRLHGYQVAYGLLVQLKHEGDEPEFLRVSGFFDAVGLPRALQDLGATADGDALRRIATAAMTAPHAHHSTPAASVGSLLSAMHSVERDAGRVVG
jgi:glycerol dehydrogenase